MAETFNVYCDESCHLENDSISVMTLGAVWCRREKVPEITARIKEIKKRHGFSSRHELKWSKVSPHHFQAYHDVVDYFFDDDDLHFRGIVVPDKGILKHHEFDQTHDTWYYKMFFVLLKTILDPEESYNILLDYKDTNGATRIAKLHKVLSNSYWDFSYEIIKSINLIRSNDTQILQIADLLTGALSYLHRDLHSNVGKTGMIHRIKERSGYSLRHTTLYKEQKFNLLIWHPTAIEM
jgi:hypothetical protein